MKIRTALTLALLSTASLAIADDIVAPPPMAAGTYTTVDVPGSDHTFLSGINARGDVVGSFYTPEGTTSAFVVHDGVTEVLAIPGAMNAQSIGIADDGTVLGVYFDADWVGHAFLLHPGASGPNGSGGGHAYGLANGNQGHHNGSGNGNGNHNGDGGALTTWDWSGETLRILPSGEVVVLPILEPLDGLDRQVLGVNSNGDLVGVASDWLRSIPFVIRDGVYETYAIPGVDNGADAEAINDAGVIIGYANTSEPRASNGYILEDGAYSLLMHPDATPLTDSDPPYRFTYPAAINLGGTVVGFYYAMDGETYRTHGFVFTPAP